MMLLSVPLALEYEATALLPEHVLASGLSMSSIQNLIDVVIGSAEAVPIHYQYRPQLSDASDEMVLEAAINGRAEVIVTFNTRDFTRNGKIVSEEFGISLIGPAEALRSLRNRGVN